MSTQSNLNLKSKESGPVECLGQTFSSDDARREHYLNLLAQKLQEPEFRKIEGFPIGEDEDILALSDPPYYTACPNPWIGEFINYYGRPYEPKEKYHREPFAADVSEGKNHPIYNAHSYHTKVPHRAIMRYILHYTEPGDMVFDGFCGTGMTGVAAQLCGDRTEVQELGYRVDEKGAIFDESGKAVSKLGARRVVLNDLGVAAGFIAYNFNQTHPNPDYEALANEALSKATKIHEWKFKTVVNATASELCAISTVIKTLASEIECQKFFSDAEAIKAQLGLENAQFSFETINYVVWSEVFSCPECGNKIVFWDSSVDKSNWQVKDNFTCDHCASILNKDSLITISELTYDPWLKGSIQQRKFVPVLIHYRSGTKAPDKVDSEIYTKATTFSDTVKVPIARMLEGSEGRRNDPHGLTHVHHFYSIRNLHFLATFADSLKHSRNYINVTSVASVGTKLYRFRSQNGSLGAGGGPLSGTLYVPSLCKEIPFPKMIKEHIKKTCSMRRLLPMSLSLVQTGSSTKAENISDASFDYLFVDPPFGGNLNYAELNYIWEAWLRVFTEVNNEAITDRVREKTLKTYQDLLQKCFVEFFRILKPGRWMTVEFSNTSASVWNAIQATLQEAGFVVANVAALDKKQKSFKAVTSPTAVKQDLVISAYKPNGGLEQRFHNSGHTTEGVWDFMRTHLRNLPVVKPRGGELEFIVERDPRILYDRMVAFYIGHGVPVPLSSAEFQAALAEKFPEREGMFFLSEQVAEWDKKRSQMEGVGQMSIFVEDEKSAIDWLRNFLKSRPSVTADITTEFMQQLGASWKKFETRPELSLLLEQNFLKYDGKGEVPSQIHSYLSTQNKDLRNLSKDDARLQLRARDRWFVPDPAKAVDVEAIRNKRLLQEFWDLCTEAGIARPSGPSDQRTLPLPIPTTAKKTGRKKLKEVRTEAVRLGFKECFAAKDYTTILAIAEHLPANVIEEDEQLQMMHDMAEMRAQG